MTGKKSYLVAREVSCKQRLQSQTSMACCSPDPNRLSDSLDGVEVGKYSNWMEELPAALHSVPLNQLAIPGSHDSFAFYLDKNAPLAPDNTPFIQNIVKIFGTKAKDIICQWSLTQQNSFAVQLSHGIRYFDIRSAWKDVSCSDGDACFVHGLWGLMIKSAMEEIEYFVRNHPKEIIILDFNHFYNFTEEKHKQLLDMLTDVFGSKLCPFIDLDTVNLEMLWKFQYQVIVFYDANVKSKFDYWPSDAIVSPWPNTTDPQKAIAYLDKNYSNPRSCHQFYVTQGVLTPDVGFVMKHLLSSLKDTCAKIMHEPFLQWIEEKKAGKNGINICIMDFVGQEKYVSSLIKLNMNLACECSKSKD